MRNTVKNYYDAKYLKMVENSFLLHSQYLIGLGIDFGEIIRLYRSQVVDGGLILDLGCGGQPSSYVFAPDSDSRIVGVDISKPGLELAKQGAQQIGYPGAFGPVMGDALRLPFGEGVFDAAVLYKSLEYMNAPGDVLAEVSRVLKKGGAIFICTLNEKYTVRKLIRLVKPSHWAGDMYPEKPYFSLKEIDAWFRASGLRVQGNCFSFNYVSAFWDVFVLPRMIRYYMSKHNPRGILRSIKAMRFILRGFSLLDWPFKRWGDSSVLVVAGRKE